jgi:hypothetical protein
MNKPVILITGASSGIGAATVAILKNEWAFREWELTGLRPALPSLQKHVIGVPI